MVFLNDLIKNQRHCIDRGKQNDQATDYFNEKFKGLFAFRGKDWLHSLFSLPSLICMKRKWCQPSTPQIDILGTNPHLQHMQTQHPLRQWRTTHNILLKNLAEQVGASMATLSRIERGLQFPRSRLMVKLVRATDLRLDDFMPAEPE
jgi:DNA-binding XRE family transcriptional regulator